MIPITAVALNDKAFDWLQDSTSYLHTDDAYGHSAVLTTMLSNSPLVGGPLRFEIGTVGVVSLLSRWS